MRVLGPVEIAGQRTVAAKPRALLALLVAARGQPVSVDRLVDELWGGAAPRSAVNLVQQYVRRLRQLLGDDDAALLRTRPPGYELVLADDQLDAARFERLVDRAAAAGADERAAARLAEALGLWRGEPFADVAGSATLLAEAERMAQLRLAAVEQRLEVEIGLGRQAGAVPELVELTVAHPLRERIWELLMLALYRSGRQADALDAYRQLYRTLDAELGIEPSRGVRELQQRILNADVDLDPPPTGVPVPRQLPAAVAGFVGRAEPLARLDALVPGADRSAGVPAIAVLTGMGGVGKTALAVHWAHRAADRFPDGQLYVNLRGFDPSGQLLTSESVMQGFLDALGVPPDRIPTDAAAKVGLYRSLLADRRVLVVIDNARDADQVRPLLPAGAGCMALVTSRDRLAGLIAAEGASPVPVELLTNVDGRRLLATRLGPEPVDAEPRAVEDVVAACGGLPLALGVVAARAATRAVPLAGLAAELRDSSTGLDAWSAGDADADVRTVFSWSYDQLSPAAAELFRLLGLHPLPDISRAAAASLAGIPPRAARSALDELMRAHLLNEDSGGRYSSHDLVHTYARELLADHPTADRDAAGARMLDHYLHSAYSAAIALNPNRTAPITPVPTHPGVDSEDFKDRDEALAWFVTEHLALLSVTEYAYDARFDTHVWQLSWTFADYFRWQSHAQDRVRTLRLALAAARRANNRVEEAHAVEGLARWLALGGDNDAARSYAEQALAVYAELGDLAGQGTVHLDLAVMAGNLGRFAEGIEHAERAHDLYRDAGRLTGVGRALNSISWDRCRLGDYRGALLDGVRALRVHRDAGDRDGEAATLDTLGYAYHQLGEHERAVTFYRDSIEILGDLGDRYNHALVLTHLGETQHAAGEVATARTTWKQALVILDDLGHPDADALRAKLADC